MTRRVFVIAEAGVNHDGDVDLARRLIDIAVSAGADAVKFQTFRAASLVTRHGTKAAYQAAATDPAERQLEMLQRLELSADAHHTLQAHAKTADIMFLSTPFDLASLQFLVGPLGMRWLKIASGEVSNAPLLLETARAATQVILSTGMSTLAEVEEALGVLAFGFVAPGAARPSREAFAAAFASEAGQAALRDKVTLLHCTTEYPAPVPDVNLRAMDTLASVFQLPVGFSDHTVGIHIALAAVARGATVIEKHFTSDRSRPGPDHKASLEPNELRLLVSQIRDVEAAMGDGVKRPAPSEVKNVAVARKSIVATVPITAGDVLSDANMTCKRPGAGMSPLRYWDLLGTVARHNYEPDDYLDE